MAFQTTEILKAILDNSPQNIVLMNLDYKVISFNKTSRLTLAHFFHRDLKIGDDYRDFVVEPAMSTFLEAFAKALQGESTEIELQTSATDFTYWFLYRVNPVYTEEGPLLGVSLSAENITERKRAERELAESENKFRNLVEQTRVGVFILRDGRFMYTNPAFATILSREAVDLLSAYHITDLILKDDIDSFTSRSKDIIESKKDSDYFILTAIRSDGEERSLEINISRTWYNEDWALLGSALDITELIDEEIRINEAVDRAQEKERTQLGMELHDNVKQLLAACLLNLKFTMNNFPVDDEARPLLHKTTEFLQQAIDDLRQLSHRLAPAVDEETPILEKVTELINRIHLKEPVQVSLDIDKSIGHLDSKMQLAVYRIIQEQFSNIISYAAASRASIKIFKDGNNLVLTVQDNGVGVDITEKTHGIGLQNIRRRVQVLGGHVHMHSELGAGFELTAYIPF